MGIHLPNHEHAAESGLVTCAEGRISKVTYSACCDDTGSKCCTTVSSVVYMAAQYIMPVFRYLLHTRNEKMQLHQGHRMLVLPNSINSRKLNAVDAV